MSRNREPHFAGTGIRARGRRCARLQGSRRQLGNLACSFVLSVRVGHVAGHDDPPLLDDPPRILHVFAPRRRSCTVPHSPAWKFVQHRRRIRDLARSTTPGQGKSCKIAERMEKRARSPKGARRIGWHRIGGARPAGHGNRIARGISTESGIVPNPMREPKRSRNRTRTGKITEPDGNRKDHGTGREPERSRNWTGTGTLAAPARES
jgi:hypothetical protein